MYTSSVEPILRYGAGIWGTSEYTHLNTVQNKAARFILGVPKTTDNLATQGDLGWTSWFCKQKVEVIRLWLRLKKMDPSPITVKVFKYSYTKAITTRIKNWERSVIDMFHTLNLHYLVNVDNFDTKL